MTGTERQIELETRAAARVRDVLTLLVESGRREEVAPDESVSGDGSGEETESGENESAGKPALKGIPLIDQPTPDSPTPATVEWPEDESRDGEERLGGEDGKAALACLSKQKGVLAQLAAALKGKDSGAQGAFWMLGGCDLLASALCSAKEDPSLVSLKGDEDEKKTVLGFLAAVLGVLDSLEIPPSRTTIEVRKPDGHETKPSRPLMARKAVQSVLDVLVKVASAVLGGELLWSRQTYELLLGYAVSDFTFRLSRPAQGRIVNPAGIIAVLKMWRKRKGRESRTDLAPLLAIDELLKASLGNGVAVWKAGAVAELMKLVMGAAQGEERRALTSIALELFRFGVGNVRDGQMLYDSAVMSKNEDRRFLVASIKASREPPFIHFGSVEPACDRVRPSYVQYPDLKGPFPPTGADGYTIAMWVRVDRLGAGEGVPDLQLLRMDDQAGAVDFSVAINRKRQLVVRTGSGSRATALFRSVIFESRKWYHIAIVHANPLSSNSAVGIMGPGGGGAGAFKGGSMYFFLAGQLVEQQRCSFPAAPTRGTGFGPFHFAMPADSAGPVRALVGGASGSSGSAWSLATLHLFGALLTDDLISVMAGLGPRYGGNFQDSLGSFQTYGTSAALIEKHEMMFPGGDRSGVMDAFRQRCGSIVSESALLLGLIARSVVEDGGAEGGEGEEEQGDGPIFVPNSAYPLLEDALEDRRRGVLENGVVSVPLHVDEAVASVGGLCFLAVDCFERAQTVEEVVVACDLVCELVRDSWRNSEAMERERGFSVLALLVREVLERFKDDTESANLADQLLSTLASFLGIDVAKPSRSIIANALGYRALFVEWDTWRRTPAPVQRRYYSQFIELAEGNRFRAFNLKRLGRMRVLRKLLDVLKWEPVRADVFPELVGAVRVLARGSVGKESVRALAAAVSVCFVSEREYKELGDGKRDGDQKGGESADGGESVPRLTVARAVFKVLADLSCDSYLRRPMSLLGPMSPALKGLLAVCSCDVSEDELDERIGYAVEAPSIAHSSVSVLTKMVHCLNGDELKKMVDGVEVTGLSVSRVLARLIGQRVDLPAAWTGLLSLIFGLDWNVGGSDGLLEGELARMEKKARGLGRPELVGVLAEMLHRSVSLIEMGASVEGEVGGSAFGEMVETVVEFVGRVSRRLNGPDVVLLRNGLMSALVGLVALPAEDEAVDVGDAAVPQISALADRRSSLVLLDRPEIDAAVRPSRIRIPAGGDAVSGRGRTHPVVDRVLDLIVEMTVRTVVRGEFAGVGLDEIVGVAGPGDGGSEEDEEGEGDTSAVVAVTDSVLAPVLPLTTALIRRTGLSLQEELANGDGAVFENARLLNGCCKCLIQLTEGLAEGMVLPPSVVETAIALLDLAGQLLEKTQAGSSSPFSTGPSVSSARIKVAGLCRASLAVVHAAFSQLSLIVLANAAGGDTTPTHRFTYWFASGVSGAFEGRRSGQQIRFVNYLLFSNMLMGGVEDELACASVNCWRLQCVKRPEVVKTVVGNQSVLYGSGPAQDRLAKGLQAVLRTENEQFLEWVGAHRAELAIMLAPVRTAWDEWVAAEEKSAMAGRARRETALVVRRERRDKERAVDNACEKMLRNETDWHGQPMEDRRRARARRDEIDSVVAARGIKEAVRAAQRAPGKQTHWRLDETEGLDRMRLRLIPETTKKYLSRDARRREEPGAARAVSPHDFMLVDDGDDKLRKVMRSLDDGDRADAIFNVARIDGPVAREGLLIVGQMGLYVLDGLFRQADNDVVAVEDAPEAERDPFVRATADENAPDEKSDEARKWGWDNVLSLSRRWYLLRDVAVEAFFTDGRSVLLTCPSTEQRNRLFAKLADRAHKQEDPEATRRRDAVRERGPSLGARVAGAFGGTVAGPVTQRWARGEMSNFAYLMWVNSVAGRTFNDLTQYPVFPWVLAEYGNAELDLDDPGSFRDLSKPMGAQDPRRRRKFEDRYQELADIKEEPFHYGTHYSSAMVVSSFLVRLEPFARANVRLQGGSFDHPDRLFQSVAAAWEAASAGGMADVRELTPEFFYLPEFLTNVNCFSFGKTTEALQVSDVALPAWAFNDPVLFVRRHRAALESPYVSKNLHLWIDLIFGVFQRGREAVEAVNVFHHLSYHGATDLERLTDPVQRRSVLGTIHHFGQTPQQVFYRAHPARTVVPPSGLDCPTAVQALKRYPTTTHAVGPIISLTFLEKSGKVAPGTSGRVTLAPAHELVAEWGYVDNGIRLFEVGTDTDDPVARAKRRPCGMAEMAHPTRVALAVSAGNNVLATTAEDAVVTLWAITPASAGAADPDRPVAVKIKYMFAGHRARIVALAGCTPLAMLVSVDEDGQVAFWDTSRGRNVRWLSLGKGEEGERAESELGLTRATAVTISPTTGDVIIGYKRRIVVLSLNGRTLVDYWLDYGGGQMVPAGAVTAVAVYEGEEGPSRTMLFTAHGEAVVIWEMKHDGTRWKLELVRVLCGGEEGEEGVERAESEPSPFPEGDSSVWSVDGLAESAAEPEEGSGRTAWTAELGLPAGLSGLRLGLGTLTNLGGLALPNLPFLPAEQAAKEGGGRRQLRRGGGDGRSDEDVTAILPLKEAVWTGDRAGRMWKWSM